MTQRTLWPLHTEQPCIEILLSSSTGADIRRRLIADTGAGSARATLELILDEAICIQAGGIYVQPILLGGAYVGVYNLYLVRVRIPALGFDGMIKCVGVQSLPPGFDGLAGFRFLNRFTYGNFGDPGQFGLEW